MFFYKYIFKIYFVFIFLTHATSYLFAIENVDTATQKKEKKAPLNKDVKFKKIFCSKKTKKSTPDDDDHADDECHEEEKDSDDEHKEQEREEREEQDREEQEREEREEEEENDDDEDDKEKKSDDAKRMLFSLCMTDEEKHLVQNLSYEQAKNLLKILQKS